MDSFSCSPINTSLYIIKTWQRLHENQWICWNVTWWCNFNTTIMSQIDVQLFVFYLSHWLVRVCEIEWSHMGQDNGNPNLVWEKNPSLAIGQLDAIFFFQPLDVTACLPYCPYFSPFLEILRLLKTISILIFLHFKVERQIPSPSIYQWHLPAWKIRCEWQISANTGKYDF